MNVAVQKAASREGRLSEFLLTGGATPLVFLAAWLLRKWLGLDEAEYFTSMVFFYAANLINNPHFAASYLLFYRSFLRRFSFGRGELASTSNAATAVAFRSTQSLRFFICGAVVPVVLAVWICLALVTKSNFLFGCLIQLMFFLVGWHYSKQAFGVLVVLSARRGRRLVPVVRNAALLHAFCGWAYAFSSPAHAATEVEESGVLYTSFAQPLWLERLTLVAFLASAVGLGVALARDWSRERPLLAPLFGYLVTIWVWTVFTSLDPLVVYAIPALHSVQYLFFVYHLKEGEFSAEEFAAPVGPRIAVFALGSCALGWLLLRGLPELLDGASGRKLAFGGALGSTPYFAAFFAFVNIHHYFLDHVLWRRENPEMRFLFAPRERQL